MTTSTGPDPRAAVARETPDAKPRLRDRAHLPVVAAAIGLVTVGAFENRAVTTVLPAVARDLDGLSLFGAASAVPAATYLIGASVAGLVTDRRGPRVPLLVGVAAAFVAALVVAAAPTMAVFIAGRAVTGVAEAGVDIALAVLVATALPAPLRARVYAMFATAWVLPSVLGPGVAGVVADAFGWRATFAVCAAFTVACVPAIWPALRRSRVSRSVNDEAVAPTRHVRTTVVSSCVAALAVCTLSLGAARFATTDGDRGAVGLVMLMAVGAGVVAFRPLLPGAVARVGRGAPAVIVVRALTSASFGALGAFLPLMLTSTHGLSAAAAGSSLTVTGVFWALGSNIASRETVQARTSDATRARIGLALIVIGGLGVAGCIATVAPVPALLVAWSFAGAGRGMIGNALATALIASAPESELGFHQSAASTLDVTAQGVALAFAGCAVAAVGATTPVFVGITAGGAFLALLALLLTGRITAEGRAGL